MSRYQVSNTKLPDSLWAHSATKAPATAPLQGQHNRDVVVIGGGFTGLSAALHLAQAGTQVCVLEAGQIGHGGSGRNVGLVNAGLWTPPDDIERILGQTRGQQLYAALGKAPDLVFDLIARFDIQCEATRNGTLHLAHSNAGLRDLESRTRQLQQRGAPVELLDADKTAALTGTDYHYGAILDPRAGTIQPLGYARGLAVAAQSQGAEIYTDTPVTGLNRTADGGWQVTTPEGVLTAKRVVLSTNAYSNGLWPNLEQSFTPLHFFQFATDPLDSDLLARILPGKQGCWDTRQVMTSLRLDQAGRLILGSVGECPDQGAPALRSWASSHLRRLFPDLFASIAKTENGSIWRFGWSGQIAYSHDHLPHLHQLDTNLITCIGYSGRGIGPGTVMGKAIAEHLLGTPVEQLPLPVTAPKSVSFRNVRGQFYSRGSDLYHLYQRMI